MSSGMHHTARDWCRKVARQLCWGGQGLHEPSRTLRASLRCLTIGQSLPWNTSLQNAPTVDVARTQRLLQYFWGSVTIAFAYGRSSLILYVLSVPCGYQHETFHILSS